tara:strand:- start:139 stop:471 length:333 start_codon:yes stop_codon:yes gene_type:complete
METIIMENWEDKIREMKKQFDSQYPTKPEPQAFMPDESMPTGEPAKETPSLTTDQMIRNFERRMMGWRELQDWEFEVDPKIIEAQKIFGKANYFDTPLPTNPNYKPFDYP